MNRVCDACTDTELIATPKAFRFGLRLLGNLVKKETEYLCPACGRRTTDDPLAHETPVERAADGDTRTGDVRRRQVVLHNLSADRQVFVSVEFPAAYRAGWNVLWPTFEGNVQDGTVIDHHGDPDLMLEFAEQYFKLYNAAVPAGRLPASLVEIMPALHLLVTAAELGFKACLTRDDKNASGHSLQRLYKALDPAHRDRIDAVFSKSYLNTNLTALGIEPPTVEAILGRYDSTYDSRSGVYTDSRYYAEPTTRFRRGDRVHGPNLVKGNTPYPTFLPEIVSAQIEAYRYFSGHERLRRRGGDVQHGAREPGNDNHGHWGVVPSSLGLCVVSVPPPAGKSAEGEDLASFEKLLSEQTPALPCGLDARGMPVPLAGLPLYPSIWRARWAGDRRPRIERKCGSSGSDRQEIGWNRSNGSQRYAISEAPALIASGARSTDAHSGDGRNIHGQN